MKAQLYPATHPHTDEPHFVYRFFGEDDRLLYVGVTYNPPARFEQHSKRSAWFADMARVTWTEYPDQAAGRRAEREAIDAEAPLYNRPIHRRQKAAS